MPILDASAVVEMLLRTPLGLDALDHAMADADGMHAPHLLDIEVTHAIRRYVRIRELPAAEANAAIVALPLLRIERYAHLLLLPRIWELRNSLSAYDATYVALAESLAQPLLTCDARLSRADGHRAKILLLQ
jgi:predicted nucleic acid-binding protein